MRTYQQIKRTEQFVSTWLSFLGGNEGTVYRDALENNIGYEIHPNTYTRRFRCPVWRLKRIGACVRARVRFVSARQTERTSSRAREGSAKPVRTAREEERESSTMKPGPENTLILP